MRLYWSPAQLIVALLVTVPLFSQAERGDYRYCFKMSFPEEPTSLYPLLDCETFSTNEASYEIVERIKLNLFDLSEFKVAGQNLVDRRVVF